jgi:REP element-mobilizing transposase RayT
MVFSTKNRERLITEEIQDRIYSYLGGAIKGEKGIPILINGMEDHVHILAALHQDSSVSAVLRNIKANSSKWLHRDLCVIRRKAATHSDGKRPPIPTEGGHRFRGKAATC